MKHLKNPITGQPYTEEITDYGIETSPPQFCNLGINGHGYTSFFLIGYREKAVIDFVIGFNHMARGLSDMTGFDVEFQHIPPVGSIYGHFGRFVVKNPKIANEEI